MGKLVFIHCNNSAVWGDSIALADTDVVQRLNISAYWQVDGSGNLLNNTSGGTQITCKQAGFATARPVRLTLSLGAISYVDLATANAAITPMSITTLPSVASGKMTATYSSTTGIGAFFGWLRQTPRKADGTDATTDGEAVYYEITMIAKPMPEYGFVGIGYKIEQKLGTLLVGRGHGVSLGGILCIDPTTGGFAPTVIKNLTSRFGIMIGTGEGSSNINSIRDYALLTFDATKSLTVSYTTLWSTASGKIDAGHDAGDAISLEFGRSGIGFINRTRGVVEDAQYNTNYFSSLTTELVAPFLDIWKVSTPLTISIDDLGIVGFDSLINS